MLYERKKVLYNRWHWDSESGKEKWDNINKIEKTIANLEKKHPEIVFTDKVKIVPKYDDHNVKIVEVSRKVKKEEEPVIISDNEEDAEDEEYDCWKEQDDNTVFHPFDERGAKRLNELRKKPKIIGKKDENLL